MCFVSPACRTISFLFLPARRHDQAVVITTPLASFEQNFCWMLVSVCVCVCVRARAHAAARNNNRACKLCGHGWPQEQGSLPEITSLCHSAGRRRNFLLHSRRSFCVLEFFKMVVVVVLPSCTFVSYLYLSVDGGNLKTFLIILYALLTFLIWHAYFSTLDWNWAPLLPLSVQIHSIKQSTNHQ